MVDDIEDVHSGVRAAKRDARPLTTDGVSWLVYELPPTVMDRRSSPSLIFENVHIVRRIRNYPPDWRQCSDEELGRLMDAPGPILRLEQTQSETK